MVNRIDGAVRTTAEKPATANRIDGRVRTVAEKESTSVFPYSVGIII